MMRLAAAALCLLAGSALAENKKEMSAEEKAMMEKYMKAATPGPAHQKMAKMPGQWKAKVISWMSPGAPPTVSNGSVEFRLLLGGRYLEQKFKGDMGGHPFEGMGVEGYDNVTGERWGTWVDSMSTGAMLMKGKCAPEATTCTMSGEASDAVQGKAVTFTSTMTVKDDNNFTFELSGPAPDGKVYKMMEIQYARAKGAGAKPAKAQK